MKPDFSKDNGLIPVIIQDVTTSKVLMLGYMNDEAYNKTLKEGKVTFFSRSKGRLWTKGETSNNFLFVKEVLLDCDSDTLLIKSEPAGPTCHTGADTCFNEINSGGINFLNKLGQTIKDRKNNPSEKSYTSDLFKKGINKIAQKVGEEAVELVIESKDNDEKLFLNEAADLVFHLMILLEEKGYSLDKVAEVLESRHKK